jgi:hypothetical protein
MTPAPDRLPRTPDVLGVLKDRYAALSPGERAVADVGEDPDALTPSASRFAVLAILDMVAAATGYRLGPAARENLRRIKFTIMDARSGDSLEPLGD